MGQLKIELDHSIDKAIERYLRSPPKRRFHLRGVSQQMVDFRGPYVACVKIDMVVN
ncbi:MAG: hypothetical protein P4L33_12400 [Capsulimonadaceae bacterium]|nr:hypothetical protein [Capsulimonadaceae bacterium]